MVQSAQEKLAGAKTAIETLQDGTCEPLCIYRLYPFSLVADPWEKSRDTVSLMLSPLREVTQIVNAIADAHPATRVSL